ncbi:succinylglutamate desuccinylase/aspartoacylase family protein [Labrys monachus]|uniref:Deacylase n=1 Tax=Labrys monachus TaxID=217067 RepID=A0ABU0FJ68_9HYPH|nr:succinylglutamate desuccinylase/aspartoacylase family protein [Labrys monachus]MDQ0394660.1 putative deacylase [Labrys monachus]
MLRESEPPSEEPSRASRPAPRRSSVFADVDLGRDGKQVGFFYVPQSPHDDAWGTVRVPLAVIKNGTGPTILFEGGNHGDEYEGPIALGELIRSIDPATIQGRIIAIPAINLPAVTAAQRTSPIDGLNFNRTFPGDPAGTLTRQLAAYVHDRLFPEADYFVDLHSGGSSLMIMPSTIIEPGRDPAHHQRNIEATLAFGAPMAVVVDNLGEARTATASAVEAGLTVVGTEMAGAGAVSAEALAICRRGIRNILAHAGLTDPATLVRPEREPRLLAVPGSEAYVLATEDGVFVPADALGASVKAGSVAGHIHFLADPGREPVALHHRIDGMLFARRQPGRVRPGNCCLVVAVPYDRGAVP